MSAAPFICPLCGRTSHHSQDAAERFCGACGFVDDVDMQRRAEAAYSAPGHPPRACDACGRTYIGPAVYCTLACALADA